MFFYMNTKNRNNKKINLYIKKNKNEKINYIGNIHLNLILFLKYNKVMVEWRRAKRQTETAQKGDN